MIFYTKNILFKNSKKPLTFFEEIKTSQISFSIVSNINIQKPQLKTFCKGNYM